MKQIAFALLAGTLALASSCKKEDLGPRPTDLDRSTVTATPAEGSILLNWRIPENVSYQYVRVTYTHPETKQLVTKLASSYSDSLRVDNLLARYGEIQFTLQPFTKQGAEGTAIQISATAKAKPRVEQITPTKLSITDANVFVSHPEATEGPKAGLVDDNDNTYYHENWHVRSPMPHYIVYKLPKAVKNFSVYLKSRNHTNRSNPEEMDIYVSDSFDGIFDTDANKAVLVKELTGLPLTQAAAYTSPNFRLDKAYNYVWFKINKVNGGQLYAAIATLHVSELSISIYDPETGKTTNE